MDVELSIEEEDVEMNNSIAEEVKRDERGAFMEMLEDEMGSSKEEEIWRSRLERMNNALAVSRTTAQHDPAEVYAAACRLVDVINGADVEEFISMVERLAEKTDPSAIFNFPNRSGSSLLHIAAHAGKDDIIRLLVDYVHDHLIAAQDDWGDTPSTRPRRPEDIEQPQC
ncbi:hypothetical protein NL676_028547 [Syzygium grande]|nr:hypothetical protein NL676_028547 [Syzygium grande]